MGIPGFYRFLTQSPLKSLLFRKPRGEVNILAIDMNGVIHTEKKRVEEEIPNASLDEKTGEIIKGTWRATVRIVSEVRPTNQLILAVDGIAPQAKVVQQRKRRYRATEGTTEPNSFDGNQITPGTVFMDLLDRYLRKQIETASINPQQGIFPNLVTYSSHRIPGEGEHKIADILRSRGKDVKSTVVIDGLDADLFMIYLPMLSSYNQMYLRRENDRGTEYFSLSEVPKVEGINRNPYDLIVKSFFIGNDFLPRFPGFSDISTFLYQVFFPSGTVDDIKKTTIVTDGKSINWRNFSNWLEYLQPFYTKKLEEWAIGAGGYVEKSFTRIQEHGVTTRMLIKWDSEKFRKIWYEHAFVPSLSHTIRIEVKDEEEMVQSYLQGANWVLKYYQKGMENVDPLWYYPYLYSPAFEDLSRFIRRNMNEMDVKTEVLPIHQPNNSVEQLLMVLPPKSKHFVPSKYQILYGKESPIADYFPIGFKLDSVGIQHEYEFIPLIPMIYPPRLHAAVKYINGGRREIETIPPLLNVTFSS